jgi:hypothetical protein
VNHNQRFYTARVNRDQDKARSKVRHVRCAPKSGSEIRGLASALDGPLRVDGAARHVIQAAKPKPRIITDHQWAAIKTDAPEQVAWRASRPVVVVIVFGVAGGRLTSSLT